MEKDKIFWVENDKVKESAEIADWLSVCNGYNFHSVVMDFNVENDILDWCWNNREYEDDYKYDIKLMLNEKRFYDLMKSMSFSERLTALMIADGQKKEDFEKTIKWII